MGFARTNIRESKMIKAGTMIVTDEKAPKFLTIEVKDDEGKVIASFQADAKTFATGSCGFHAQGKITNQKSLKKYQANFLLTLIGSKPPK
jgi:hypothetical protein